MTSSSTAKTKPNPSPDNSPKFLTTFAHNSWVLVLESTSMTYY